MIKDTDTVMEMSLREFERYTSEDDECHSAALQTIIINYTKKSKDSSKEDVNFSVIVAYPFADMWIEVLTKGINLSRLEIQGGV